MSSRPTPARGPAGRTTEPCLRQGLAPVYRAGFRLSVTLLALGVTLPLFGWGAAAGLAGAGVVVLLATPVAAMLQVGRLALVHRDRALAGVVAGIVVLLVVAVLVSYWI